MICTYLYAAYLILFYFIAETLSGMLFKWAFLCLHESCVHFFLLHINTLNCIQCIAYMPAELSRVSEMEFKYRERVAADDDKIINILEMYVRSISHH